ncbi:MAG TPA: hypothetical protein VJ208_03000 [Candidatus Nanoarchaeia archaeon]|nr:hypothetical protein [Candidatus Nanoarchaeia archaeon]
MPEYLAVFQVKDYKKDSENSPSHYCVESRVKRFNAENGEQAIEFANGKISGSIRAYYDSIRHPYPTRPFSAELQSLELKLIVKVGEVIFEPQRNVKRANQNISQEIVAEIVSQQHPSP